MLLNELDPNLNLDGVDLVDDLHHFMINDPAFYKTVLFPAITNLRDKLQSNQDCSEGYFIKCVNKGMVEYCKKFKVGNPTSVFTKVDRDSLARKIFGTEKENIINGQYDPRKERWADM